MTDEWGWSFRWHRRARTLPRRYGGGKLATAKDAVCALVVTAFLAGLLATGFLGRLH